MPSRRKGRFLESLGYEVFDTSTPGETIRMAREHAGEIHLLLTDVVMPATLAWSEASPRKE